MFQKIISQVRGGDHRNLHRVSFFLWWVGSYAIAWMLIYVYENPFIREMCNFAWWLRGDWQHTAVWREDLFIGLIFGLVLAGISSWLLKARYGYIPRGWRVGTIIGAMLTGFGYPRIGSRMGYILGVELTNDLLIWFVVLSAFQAIVMWRVSKRSWRLFAVGWLAAGVGIFILYLELLTGWYSPYARLAIPIGTLIQACGTALVTMTIMAHPRKHITSKTKNDPKAKQSAGNKLYRSLMGYVLLWASTFLLSGSVAFLLQEINFYTSRFFSLYDYQTARYVSYAVMLIPFGIVLGISQQWILKRAYKRDMDYWWLFTAFGWMTLGIFLTLYRYDAGWSSQNFWSQVERDIVGVLWYLLPLCFQSAVAMIRLRRGWLWLLGLPIAYGIAWYIAPYRVIDMPVTIFALVLGSVPMFMTFYYLQSKTAKRDVLT